MVQGVVVQITTFDALQVFDKLHVADNRLHRKLHIDRRALDLLIFDLGLGQRGALDHRPHHRL